MVREGLWLYWHPPRGCPGTRVNLTIPSGERLEELRLLGAKRMQANRMSEPNENE
jgi:hypothetical protein